LTEVPSQNTIEKQLKNIIMPVNHLISLDGDYIKYQKQFEKILSEINIPYSSQLTKDGIVYTIHFNSESQYEEFKMRINKIIPYPFL
jgi:hypothetical protein